jgi:hypothetical protein
MLVCQVQPGCSTWVVGKDSKRYVLRAWVITLSLLIPMSL